MELPSPAFAAHDAAGRGAAPDRQAGRQAPGVLQFDPRCRRAARRISRGSSAVVSAQWPGVAPARDALPASSSGTSSRRSSIKQPQMLDVRARRSRDSRCRVERPAAASPSARRSGPCRSTPRPAVRARRSSCVQQTLESFGCQARTCRTGVLAELMASSDRRGTCRARSAGPRSRRSRPRARAVRPSTARMTVPIAADGCSARLLGRQIVVLTAYRNRSTGLSSAIPTNASAARSSTTMTAPVRARAARGRRGAPRPVGSCRAGPRR